MSIFDGERSQLGLKPVGGSSTPASSSDSKSIFADERAGIKPQPSFQQQEQKFGATFQDPSQSPVIQQANQYNASNPSPPHDSSRDIPVIGSILKGLDYVANSPLLRTFDNAAGQSMGVPDNMMNPAKSTGSPLLDKVTQLVGGTAGYLTNPAQIEQNVGQTFFGNQTLQNVGNKISNAIESKLPNNFATRALANAGEQATNNGLGMAAYAPFQTLNQGGDFKDIPKNMLEQGLMGAGLGATGGLAGSALSKSFDSLFSRIKPSEAAPIEQGQLALPPAKSPDEIAKMPFQDRLQYTDDLQSKPKQQLLLGQGQGGFTAPTRLKISDPTQTLDYVMNKIKPEVMQTIEAPTRRDLLVQYIQKNTQIPVNEIHNMKMTDLQDLGQNIQQDLHAKMPEIATQVAAKYGHDLPSLLEGQAPNLRNQISKDAQSRVYGIPARDVNIQKPSFNIQHEGQALSPKETYKFGDNVNKGNLMDGKGTKLSDTKNVAPKLSDIRKEVAASVERPTTSTQRSFLREGTNTTREYGTLTSLKESPKTDAKLIDTINKKGDTTYEVKHNQETVDNANQKLAQEGQSGATSYLLNKSPKEILSSDDLALGYRLIDELTKKGDHEGAANVALKLMQSNVEGGRSVQINSIYNKLSTEGILRTATKQINEGVKLAEQKPLPPKVVEQITEAATKLKDATANTQISKEAISILDKAKSGGKLSESEISKLKQFANEAKKYIPEKDAAIRKRDKVIEFTSQKADQARKRLAASRQMGFAAVNKGNPIVDYAIIGTDYMAKGVVKFADFAETMVKEFGNKAQDNIDEIYNKAWENYRSLKNIKMSDFEKLTNQAIMRENINELNPQQAQTLKRMAVELSQLEGNVQKEALGELQHAFNALKEGTWQQKSASLLRSAQLGTLRTILRNEIGNNAFYILDTLRRKFIATPIDLMTSWKGNRQTFFKNNPESWMQYFKDWMTGYKAGKQGINPKGLETQYDFGGLAFNPTSSKLTDRVGSFLERQVGAVMKAGDYASANRAIATKTYQIARARAYSEGLRGKALADKAETYYYTADEKMQEAALEYGKYMTFQDKNFLSDAAQVIKDKVLNLGQDFGLGNVFFNYPKTPANIFMRAVDYSPMGFLKFMSQATGILSKDATKADVIDSLSRAIAGTGIGAIGAYLAYIGLVNVLPSKNKDQNSLERSAGIIPNSINIDGMIRYIKSFGDKEQAQPQEGDHYTSIDWFQPMSIPFSAGAAFGQKQTGSRLDKSANAADSAIQSLDAATSSATNMSLYSNLKDLFGRNSESTSDYVGRQLSNVATAGIPSILGQLRNAIDPNTRNLKSPSVFGQVANSVQNKIPFASKGLEPKIDTLGKEVKSDYGIMGRVFNAFVNPSIMDQYNPSEGAKVTLDIINRTGNTAVSPSTAPKSFTYKKDKYVFSPQEYTKFQQVLGGLVDQGIQNNLKTLQDPNKTDDVKVKVLDKIMTESLDRAKNGARKQMTPLLSTK